MLSSTPIKAGEEKYHCRKTKVSGRKNLFKVINKGRSVATTTQTSKMVSFGTRVNFF